MDGFIGEIRPFAFGFVPQAWLPCSGQLLSIQQYTALYAVIGTIYGGNGTTNFQLPNLMGITPLGSGTSPTTGTWPIGGQTGSETVTLTQSQIPVHNHTVVMEVVKSDFQANTTAAPAVGSSWLTHPMQMSGDGSATVFPNFTPSASGNLDTTLNPSTIGMSGGNTGHENRQPYLAIQFCICNDGLFPTRN